MAEKTDGRMAEKTDRQILNNKWMLYVQMNNMQIFQFNSNLSSKYVSKKKLILNTNKKP